MKRVCCLLLAALLLLAIFGCKSDKQKDSNTQADNGPKKDQVVHVGETVQYGDLTFTFDKQADTYDIERYPRNWEHYTSIHLICEYHGNGEVFISGNKFKIYIDGNQSEGSDRVYRTFSRDWESSKFDPNEYREAFGFDYKSAYNGITLTNGRSADLWIMSCGEADAKTVEFDYVNSAYSDEWGKVTFAVDLP